MHRTKRLLATLVLTSGLLAFTATAQAGLIPNKVTVTPDGEQFRWTYNVVVTSDVYVKPGDYFTIYDFAGPVVVDPTAPNTAWQVSTQNVGITPDKTTPLDDPNIPNYTWTYSGTENIMGSTGLGNFSLLSPFSLSSLSDFTSATHRQDNNDPENNITSTVTPVAAPPPPPDDPTDPPAETPEPASLALLGMALPFAVMKLRRRK
jgi:hypothetical protein